MKYGKLHIKMEDGKTHEFNQSKNGDIIKAEDWITRANRMLSFGVMYHNSTGPTASISGSAIATPANFNSDDIPF
jgi:hypothetical protein